VALHVLIVEDDVDARGALRALLELDGYRVDDAGDAVEGLGIVRTTPPDVAVIDIGLPGTDGYELARQIRAEGRRVHLVALTGWGQPEDRQRALEAGFDAHLVKPVDPADLTRLFATLADRGLP
jgi:CheY-like chemotaxis protein